MIRALAALLSALLVLGVASGAQADQPLVEPVEPVQKRPPTAPARPPDDGPPIDYDTERLEPAGFPLIAGNSDIGVEFGGVGTLTRFAHGQRPYIWNIDVVLAISIKDGPHGAEIAQQNYYAQLDATDIFDTGVRSTSALYYNKFVDTGYFGRGNDSSATRPPVIDGNRGRFFQYVSREVRLRSFDRFPVAKPFDLMVAPILRWHDPEAYPGSKLAVDAQTRDASGRPLVHGLHPTMIGSLGAGAVVDTRDNEFFPRRGMYHQMGTRFGQGVPTGDVQFGGTGFVLANYFSLPGPFVFATRLVLDFLYGDVPFYDLYNGGPFNTFEMPGGGQGIRGVPLGRYSGPVKAVGNAELRVMHARFKLLGQKFRLGNDVFFDTGRVWDDYTFASPRDGRGLGLKWGAGGGVYVVWGEAAVFRIEMAYSPDATAENTSFPVGLYVADGVMF
jgi:hypothetical protein